MREILVNLSESDIAKIKAIAKGRYDRARKYGRKPKYGQPTTNLIRDNEIGVIGEFAYSKWMGIFYDGNGDKPDKLDVGGVQIRTTQRIPGILTAHEGERKDIIYVLAWGKLNHNQAYLLGWCFGSMLFKPENWRDHFHNGRPPCYGLRENKLFNMDALKCRNFGNIPCGRGQTLL